jgi:hypothetical protein
LVAGCGRAGAHIIARLHRVQTARALRLSWE